MLIKTWIRTHKNKIIPTALILTVLVYFSYICFINFSLEPSFYCTDMYSDMLYSVRAWETKSIFPDGWVFGNQYYVVATPVLAAFVYGIVGNPALAMAIATVIMTLGIALSMLWMLKPVFPRLEGRLIALLCFAALTAYCADIIHSISGWQLFFTMSSYYACYVITAFLCFGFVLRRNEPLTKSRIALFGLALFMSFGTGMQSLRQTLITIIPILLLEGILQLKSLIKQRKIMWQPLLITGSIAVFNLLGALIIRLLNIPQHEIFSSMEFLKKADLPASVNNMLKGITEILTDQKHSGVLVMSVLAFVVVAYFQAKWQKNGMPIHWGKLISLFVFSVLGIAFVDVFTKMSIRSIYYFMLFPLIAIILAYAYTRWKGGKPIILTVVVLLVVGSFRNSILPAAKVASKADDNFSYEISEMLIEKGYTVIYSGWNQCEDVAIASGGKITAGFWDSSKDVFRPVKYLCDPSIYEADAEKCVYYLRNDNREIALAKARERGVTMTLVAEYKAWGIYLYEASENLMMP